MNYAGSNKENLRKSISFYGLLKPYRPLILLSLLVMLVANTCALVLPWAIKLVIDDVLPAGNPKIFSWLIPVLILAALIKACAGYASECLAASVGEKVVMDLRSRLYWHVQKLSVRYVENNPIGTITAGIIGDVDSIRSFLFGGMVDFIYSSLSIIFLLGVLVWLNYQLALIAVIYLPVFCFLFIKYGPRLKYGHARVREKYAELTGRLTEALNGIRIVSGFGAHERETAKFNAIQKDIYRASMGNQQLGVMLWMAAEFLSGLGLVILIWIGVKMIVSGRMTTGSLMAFYAYLGMLFYPVIRIAVINTYYQEARASMERISRVFSQEPLVREADKPIALARLKKGISFQNVHFSYDKSVPVLRGVTFDVGHGESLAIAGKSGSGKTTIINLLLRFYDPGSGRVLIDGHDLKELSLKDYRSMIAMVIQDDYLFSGSIRDNISYGKPEAGESQIEDAAKMANAHDFIRGMPDGYNTLIGERGIKLSHGQRQRISIARAILLDPDVLILDEATSSVDSRTERAIIEDAYRKVMKGRSVFIVAHRLSPLTLADRIIFLEEGSIAEEGTHEELMSKRGEYWQMYNEQQHKGFAYEGTRVER